LLLKNFLKYTPDVFQHCYSNFFQIVMHQLSQTPVYARMLDLHYDKHYIDWLNKGYIETRFPKYTIITPALALPLILY